MNIVDKEYVSVISVTIKDPDSGHPWHCWEKYIKGQLASKDKDMETEMARLMNLGFKVIRGGVRCCLSETSYDKSIQEKLKDNESFIENYIN
tara:strand:- start:209 stop:484 length:276 start_codon:yes stop_codon:yes gene_type:complete